MAQITTFNAAQKEVAQKFVEAYVQAEGEEFAADLVIVGKANHRFAITLPGDEGHTEYTYSNMKELIAEYTTRGSAVSQVAALASGGFVPATLDNEIVESAINSAQVGSDDDISELNLPSGPVAPAYEQYLNPDPDVLVDGVVGDVDGDGDASGSDDSSSIEFEVEGEGAADLLPIGGGEFADRDDGAEVEGDGAEASEAGEGGEGEGQEADAADKEGEEADGSADGADDGDRAVEGGDSRDADADGGGEVHDAGGEGGSEGDDEEGERGEPSKKDRLKDKVKKGQKSKKSHAISTLIAQMMKHSDAGAHGKLAMAEDLHDLDRIAKEEGLNRNEQLDIAQSFFESRGRKFPDTATRSRLKSVWQAWFADTGYDLEQELESPKLLDAHGVPKTTTPDSDKLLPMPLASQDYSALYLTRNLVDPDDDEHNAALLAMINTFSYKTIGKVAPHLDVKDMEAQFDEWLQIKDPVERENRAVSWADARKGIVKSDFKSISVPAGTYDAFMDMLPRMTELAIESGIHEPVEGKESSVSKTFLLDMLMATWEQFTDSDKVLFIKLHHGTISAEEYTALTGKDMDIEVEDMPSD